MKSIEEFTKGTLTLTLVLSGISFQFETHFIFANFDAFIICCICIIIIGNKFWIIDFCYYSPLFCSYSQKLTLVADFTINYVGFAEWQGLREPGGEFCRDSVTAY